MGGDFKPCYENIFPLKHMLRSALFTDRAGTDGGSKLIGDEYLPGTPLAAATRDTFAERAPLPLQIINLQTGSQNNDRNRIHAGAFAELDYGPLTSDL
jgi:hypothetical protein